MTITISEIKPGKIVLIEKNSYEYRGQEIRKQNGVKKSMYVFKGMSVNHDLTFSVTKPLTFSTTETGVLKMDE